VIASSRHGPVVAATKPDGRWRAVGTALLARSQVVVILAALVSVPLTLAEVNGQTGDAFLVADWAIWSVFAGEYLLALALARNRRRHLVTAWLPLLVVVVSFPMLPAVFAMTRLARLSRLFRLVRLVAFGARALPAIRSTLGRRGLLYVVAVFLMLITVSGAIMSVVEPQTVKGNMFDGMWWSIVTATTVGYGDISPQTTMGRLVAVALMLFGIGVTATLAASVAAYFVGQDQAGSADVAARLERIERLLLMQSGQPEVSSDITGGSRQ
jgi:voltage-gated potassium channel